MADWSPLRARLRLVEDELTIAWQDLDALVAGLPRSAYDHSAFWSGARSAWPGFRTRAVGVGHSVTFVRQDDSKAQSELLRQAPARVSEPVESDVILVGCVKSKLGRPAAARDLYTSPLFQKARLYAEQSGKRWFVLSAQHGLVDPQAQLAPYDLHLASTPPAYRRSWAARVLDQLRSEMGSLDGLVVEVHAGAAYAGALEGPLSRAGAVLIDRLQGLRMGQRLAWYPKLDKTSSSAKATSTPWDVSQLVAELARKRHARRPDEIDKAELGTAGLYSWWVDAQGASDLARGLRQPVGEGLIYAGLAGATRELSGQRSTNTLWGRIDGMHLGKRSSFSTFRLSLGAAPSEQRGESEIDEDALTAWMRDHLMVVAVPVADVATLGAVETAVLEQLDPPLNLAKRPRTPLRDRLSELRKQHRR